MKVLGLCLLLIAAGAAVVLFVRWLSACRSDRARRLTPWSEFSRATPDGQVAIGIERAWRGRVFEQINTHTPLSPDAEGWEVEIARDRARTLATIYNRERGKQ